VRPAPGGKTRLVIRGQGNFELPDLGPANFFYWRLFFEPVHFLMERKMMLNIRRLAEQASQEKVRQAPEQRAA
jgi:hypothetical protein